MKLRIRVLYSRQQYKLRARRGGGVSKSVVLNIFITIATPLKLIYRILQNFVVNKNTICLRRCPLIGLQENFLAAGLKKIRTDSSSGSYRPAARNFVVDEDKSIHVFKY